MYDRGMKRYIIRVTGKVQGVFYRDSARRVATTLGLSGVARNDPDGSVYIEVEGEESALEEFLEWCSVGPEHAIVQQARHNETEPIGYEGFEIR